MVKAAHETGTLHFAPGYAMAVFVPLAALTIWLRVRHIRREHINEPL